MAELLRAPGLLRRDLDGAIARLGDLQPAVVHGADVVDGLVLLVFIPTQGTRYADRQPLPVPVVAELLAEARIRFSDVPLFLGCMRPKGRYRAEIDPLAVKAGVNVLVGPARSAREAAVGLGLRVLESRECCVL